MRPPSIPDLHRPSGSIPGEPLSYSQAKRLSGRGPFGKAKSVHSWKTEELSVWIEEHNLKQSEAAEIPDGFAPAGVRRGAQ
jgi:hypothetical protein